MEAILRRGAEQLEDYYGLLGCDETATTEQIVSEYKVRALACHPDKHPENAKSVTEFQKLQEAKDVLTDETKRKNYDFWLRSRITIPFSEWQALSDSVKTKTKNDQKWTYKFSAQQRQAKKGPMLEAATDGNLPGTCSRTNEVESDDQQLPSSDYWHRRFRWPGEAPSALLQKFRNYEI